MEDCKMCKKILLANNNPLDGATVEKPLLVLSRPGEKHPDVRCPECGGGFDWNPKKRESSLKEGEV